YLLSNAPADTPVAEFARVLNAHHRVEECLQRAKGEAGLADYQVRTWGGGDPHQAPSPLATRVLTQGGPGGEKSGPRLGPPGRSGGPSARCCTGSRGATARPGSGGRWSGGCGGTRRRGSTTGRGGTDCHHGVSGVRPRGHSRDR